MVQFIEVSNHALRYCTVKAMDARNLNREEILNLMAWCDCQDESFWDNLTLQEILNVYRVSADYMTFQDWTIEQPRKAWEAYNRAVLPHNRAKR